MEPLNSADLLLHPVRLRIVQLFLGGRTLNTSEIVSRLPEVSQATLYRHVRLLAKAGVLTVTGERQVRGAHERTYGLEIEASHVDPEDLAAMTGEDHRRAFMGFIASLLSRFDRYISRDSVDLARDRVGYRQTALWLTDEEFDDLAEDLRKTLATRTGNTPGGKRKLHTLSTIFLPVDPRTGE
ncbi:MAG: helix-turn-helix domain-containing protein [Arthrobacter sp.]